MSVFNHHVVYPEMIIACREEDLGTGNPRFFRGYGGELVWIRSQLWGPQTRLC